MLRMKASAFTAFESLERRTLCTGSGPVPVMIVPTNGCECMTEDTSAEAFAAEGFTPSIVYAGFDRSVSFLPTAAAGNASVLSNGYLPDTGGMYAERGADSYGWSRDLTSKTRLRSNPKAPDSRYNSTILIGSSDVWEMSVPDGKYNVRLVAGDASYTDSTFRFNVEGKLAMDAKPSGVSYWVERSITVDVTDGKLTISSASGAVNNKLAFVNISSAGPALPGPELDWKAGSVALPFHRVENGAVQIGSKLYVMGGFITDYWHVTNSFQIYDFNTGKWTTKGDMPGSQTHFALATDGKYIYKMAGQYGPMFSTKGTNEGWKYEISTGKWTKMANLPAVRFGGAMEYLNGKLYYWGGDDASRSNAQSELWTLDLTKSNAKWTASTPIPLAGDHLSHAIVDGKIYSIGGEHDHGKSYVQHDYVFEFDPATSVWTRKADMPTPASHFEAGTFAYDGYIWAVGGQVDHELLTNETRVYDPKRDIWSVATDFPEERKGGTVAIWQGNAYYISGDSSSRGAPGLGTPKGSWRFTIPDLSQVVTPYRGVFSPMRLDNAAPLPELL